MPGYEQKELKDIRSESASLQIGKNGLSNSFVEELNARLRQNGVIKLKFLKNAPFKTRESALSELKKVISDETKILETRGWTVILQRKK
jgi:RNA-binding protein YhbY